ncbi:hypothetical protein, partial [Providencia rettgeri]|uniref:hypothetical protein n=1 Tax=Providencia rettgeri TaxID=587 RepID=UPI001C7D1745
IVPPMKKLLWQMTSLFSMCGSLTAYISIGINYRIKIYYHCNQNLIQPDFKTSIWLGKVMNLAPIEIGS